MINKAIDIIWLAPLYAAVAVLSIIIVCGAMKYIDMIVRKYKKPKKYGDKVKGVRGKRK